MNGFELYKEIRKVDEKVRVCFLTASEIYHESLRVPPQTLKDVKCFIPKPIAIDDFIKRIKEELSPMIKISKTGIDVHLEIIPKFVEGMTLVLFICKRIIEAYGMP